MVVTPSWFLAAAVLTLVFAPTVRGRAPGLDMAGVLVVTLAFVLMLFASVFLHEVAHALVARSRGHRVTELALTVWGGHTAYTGASRRPIDGALIAVVGPLTNLVLAAASAVVFWLVYEVSIWDVWLERAFISSVVAWFIVALASSNALVAVFNLLPGLPLDGGQILESLVWAVTGSRTRGTVAAGWIGRVVAVGVLAWSLLTPMLVGRTPDVTNVILSALIGAFLWSGAGGAVAAGRRQAALSGLTVRGLAVPAVAVPVGTSVADAAAAVAGRPNSAVVVVAPDGAPTGWIDPSSASGVPASLVASTPVDAVVVPFEPGTAIDAGLAGAEMLAHLAQTSRGARLVPVVDGGRVTGVLDVARVAAAMRG